MTVGLQDQLRISSYTSTHCLSFVHHNLPHWDIMHVFGACELALHEVDPYKRLTAGQALHHPWIHNRRKSAKYLEYVQNVSNLHVVAECCRQYVVRRIDQLSNV